MTTAALGSGASPARLSARERTARRGGLARLAAFVPLSLFGLIVWAGLVAPTATTGALAMAAAGAAGGGALLVAGTITSRPRRNALLAVTALAVVAAAFLSAGVPARLLIPDRWDDLVTGIADGIQAMPGITVPYQGTDEWVRQTLMLGATALVAIATFQAFWPRERGEVPGSALGAAFSLGTLYAVPVIEHGPDRPYVSGAVFAVLLAAFLFADRIQLTQIPGAAVLVALATLTGFVVAPALDSNGPWIDYRHIADDVSDAGTVGYRWNHDYGPLDWPRKGRVLLKIKAQSPAYWKAEVLDTFDGRIWRQTSDDGGTPAFESDGDRDVTQPQWFQDIHVEVRGLRSAQFISAGVTRSIDHATRQPIASTGGTFETARGLLRPGATYDASVYTPRPTASRMERAPFGTDYSSDVERWLRVEIPDLDGQDLPRRGDRERPDVSFPAFGVTDRATVVDFPRGGIPDTDGAALLRRSSLRRIYDLSQSLKRGTQNPYDYVKAVEARVKNGATYTETPGRHAHPLDAFLFTDRRGYCQHFSGAMALLLRMGGVPARIATGFTPGQADDKGTTFTVRDFDAHSWVEVYFPGIGWVTFDPTPSAAPAREQTTDEQAALNVPRGASAGDGDRLSDPSSGAASSGSGAPWTEIALVSAALLAALGAFAVALVRRRRRNAAPLSDDAEIAALERALRRSGRPLPPRVTLAALERQLAGSAGAREYLRALSARRFGPGGPPPSRAARQAMRRELAAGLGRWGRLRSWWALPPSVVRPGGGRRPAGRYPG